MDPGRPTQAPGDRYKKIIGDEDKVDRLLVELFLQTHDTPPEDIWVELDATDNSAHCDQETDRLPRLNACPKGTSRAAVARGRRERVACEFLGPCCSDVAGHLRTQARRSREPTA